MAGAKKLVPVRVTATLLPWLALVGLMEMSVGGGATVNVTALVVPFGVVTVTAWGPRVALAAITKVANRKLLFEMVGFITITPAPPKLMVRGLTKPVPKNETGTDAPCAPLAGMMEVSVGGPALTVNICVPLVPPLVLTLRSSSDPIWKLEAICKVAVIVVLFTRKVFVTVALRELLFTVSGAIKPVPVSVIGTFVPAMPLLGLTMVSVGGGVTVKLKMTVLPILFGPPAPSKFEIMK